MTVAWPFFFFFFFFFKQSVFAGYKPGSIHALRSFVFSQLLLLLLISFIRLLWSLFALMMILPAFDFSSFCCRVQRIRWRNKGIVRCERTWKELRILANQFYFIYIYIYANQFYYIYIYLKKAGKKADFYGFLIFFYNPYFGIWDTIKNSCLCGRCSHFALLITNEKQKKTCHATYLILLPHIPALLVTSLIQTTEHWYRLLSTDTDCWAEHWYRLLSTDTDCWAEHWYRLLSTDTDCWALIQTAEHWHRLLSTDTDCWAQSGGTHGRVFKTF